MEIRLARAGKLNALRVKKLTTPGRYGDGAGLWLQVRSPTNRSWLFRYMIARRPRWLGLGDEAVVSLAMARQKAAKARETIASGNDPLDVKRAAEETKRKEQSVATFSQVMEKFLSAQGPAWRNDKHRKQWRSTLETYALPTIGKRRIDEICTDDVVTILTPIWLEKSETASRLRGRIERILDFARASGWRAGENPARWDGHLAQILAPKGKVAVVKHHAALAWPELPAFMTELARIEGVAAKAFTFLILTAARTAEVTGARWDEIDLTNKVWTIPAGRMKAKREHRVPMPDAAMNILAAIGPIKHGAGWVFPGAKNKHLSNMAFLMTLRRMDRTGITAHGFRSTFREWAAETTVYPREVSEAALAHTNKDRVEAAYLRSDHFTRRQALMAEWASYCFQTPTKLNN